MRPALSVCTLAYAEEESLRRALASVAWADERVVVLDDRSAGASEQIAREAGARVVRHAFEGDVEQRKVALTLARHEWVMLLDADEAVPEPLAGEIQRTLAADGGRYVGYELNRVTYHLGRWHRHGDFYPDWVLRIFRRSKAQVTGLNPHGRVVVDGSVRRLQGELQHYSYRDLSDQVARIQSFSGEAARALWANGRRARLRDLVLRPPARFVRGYVLKAGFRDGVPGLVVAAATAFHVFLKYAKLWELERIRAARVQGAGSERPTPASTASAPR